MAAEPVRFREVIESIADGLPIDWGPLDETADVTERRRLGQLRIIAGVAEVHRSIQAQESSDTTTVMPSLNTSGAGVRRWGHLVLLAKIGEGAFGEVYRARDPWLDREVALKLLRPEVAGHIPATRLVDEARTLARVRHPNVVTVYGADSHDGRVGLWMELVRGRTLSQIVAAEGPFSASEASLIGQEMCRALSAVHAAGLVHRDIKAQNAMRESGGRLVLMDFGAGGTPVYLAPELLTGGIPSVSSDVYAMGVLLYYLVTADFPVYGATVRDLTLAHARGERRHLGEKRPDLPPTFVAVVERATDSDPSRRFASMRLMQEALREAGVAAPETTRTPVTTPRWEAFVAERRRPAAVTALVLATVLVAAWVTWLTMGQTRERPGHSGEVWLAVLPFRPIGSNPDTIYYSEGLADDLTAQLARLASVRVVSSASSRKFKDESPAEIGRQLNVAALVTGSVRLQDDQLRVVVEVVEAGTAEQLWADTFDRPLRDVLSVQREIVQRVALAVSGSLSRQDESRLARRQIDPRAFDLYLKGRYFANARTPDGIRRSLDHFSEAVRIDDRAGLLYAGLADAFLLARFYNVDEVDRALEQTEANALRATALEPELGEAQAALGGVRLIQFRWSEAEESLTRALALNPSNAQAHHWYALLLAQHRRFDEALSHMRDARAIDPHSHALGAAAAYILLSARRFQEARREYEDIVKIDPANFLGHVGLVETDLARGAVAEAQRALDNARLLTGRGADLNVLAAHVYALAGDEPQARSLIAEVTSSARRIAASSAEIACVFGALGDLTEAFAFLERAIDEGDTLLGYIAIDPRFDSLRADPRFEKLLARLGLPSMERSP